jgi:hypothetical protein
MKLEYSDEKFKRQIREVPVLHLTKQKIVNISSAYKKAGLLEIVRYMTNNEKLKDLTTLISTENIRNATKLMRRVAIAFTLCFQLQFLDQLEMKDREELFEDLQAPDATNLSSKWDDKFLKFLGAIRMLRLLFTKTS